MEEQAHSTYASGIFQKIMTEILPYLNIFPDTDITPSLPEGDVYKRQHLGITIDHLQNSISIFGFRIAFYGIIIGIGILAGLWVATSDAKRRDVYKRQIQGNVSGKGAAQVFP